MTGLAQPTGVPEQPAPEAAQTEQTTAAPAPATAAPPGYKVEETRLGEFRWLSTTSFPIGAPDAISISSDGRHVASYVNRGDCRSVGTLVCFFVDGKPYPIEYGYLNSLALSFDGRHIAYSSDQPKSAVVVLDGRKVAESATAIVGYGDLVFSPDGKHLAYSTRKGCEKNKFRRAVIDTETGQEYEAGSCGETVGELLELRDLFLGDIQYRLARSMSMGWKTFSPDSKRVAYAHRQGKKWSIVVDGQEGTAYDDLLTNTLQVQFNQVLYNKYMDRRWVFEAEVSKPCPSGICFSQDGVHLAYAAKKGGMWVIVLDGKEVGEYTELGPGSPSFSPDGKHIAITARFKGSRSPWQVVVDGHAGPMFALVLNPSFSSDGKHIAYIAAEGRSFKLIVDDRPVAEYYEIGDWVFSPDVKHLAYTAVTHKSAFADWGPYGGAKWSVILDGHAGSEYSIILPHTLVFDPNGTLEFLAVQQEGHSRGIIGDPHGSLFRVKYIPMQ
jgi:WD40 repeat protein